MLVSRGARARGEVIHRGIPGDVLGDFMDVGVFPVSCRHCGDTLCLCFGLSDAEALSSIIECGGCLAYRIRPGAGGAQVNGLRLVLNAAKTPRPRISALAQRTY